MRKRRVAICLSLVVAIVLLAAFVPSCAQIGCTIQVKATLCGEPWTGNVSYNLTPASGAAINGHNVTATFGVACNGTWTCAYVSGGPLDAYCVNITPSETQSVTAGNMTTFTLNFELNQDAAIQFSHWTVNGVRYPETTWEGGLCNIIDVHFLQWVDGCTGYNVTLNEMSLLQIIQTQAPQGAPPAMIYVVNDDCAVNKTPAPSQKVFQVTSINNATADVGANITLVLNVPTMLDLHTQWQLVKCTNYTKSINWFGISKAPYVPGVHPCVLFELVLPPVTGQYVFQVQASAHVALVDDVDVDPTNNDASSLFQLAVIVNVP